MIQNIKNVISTGRADDKGMYLSDEKSIAELGLIGGQRGFAENVILKVIFDVNPIIIRVNLSHSMHQPKPSGSGAGHHN
jgi:hypothetical protein